MRNFKHRGLFFAALLLLAAAAAVPSPAQTRLYLVGQGNFAAESGSADDYVEGSNDFPISGAHTTFGLGIGLAAGSRLFFYGVEFLYHLQGTTTLTDPSDNDRVEIDTYRYLTGVLRVGTYLLHTSSLRLYLEGGGGISHTPDKDVRIYTSEQDYETEIGPPEKEFPLTFFAGAGLELPLSADLALMVGGRWIYLSLEQGQSVIAVRAGLSFSF